jgi:hypothetical protein
MIVDEIAPIQTGNVVEKNQTTLSPGEMNFSGWIDFPTKYKFTGMEILLDFNVKMIQRSSYDILSLLGDIGGLLGTLQYIGFLLTSWFTERFAKSIITQNLFTQSKSGYK